MIRMSYTESMQANKTHINKRHIDFYLATGLKWCFVKSCEYKCFKRSQSVRERKKKRKKKLKNLQLH